MCRVRLDIIVAVADDATSHGGVAMALVEGQFVEPSPENTHP